MSVVHSRAKIIADYLLKLIKTVDDLLHTNVYSLHCLLFLEELPVGCPSEGYCGEG